MWTNPQKTPNSFTFTAEIFGAFLKSFGVLLKTYVRFYETLWIHKGDYTSVIDFFNESSFPVTLFYYTLVFFKNMNLNIDLNLSKIAKNKLNLVSSHCLMKIRFNIFFGINSRTTSSHQKSSIKNAVIHNFAIYTGKCTCVGVCF